MRIFRLVVLLAIAFVITVIVRFPAAPVVDRLRPQLGPVALEGVEGPLIGGSIARARSTDDLLPLEFSDVRWSLAPSRLLQGAGVDITFDGYGGGGGGKVTRVWNGDIAVDDFVFTADAKALEPLLPVPLASFSGTLDGDIATLALENNLLTRFEGRMTWSNALLERPVRASLGTLDIVITPQAAGQGAGTHVATLNATGGDVAVDGSVTVALNGDFQADVLLTPAADAPAELTGALSRMARPESGGRFRLQQSGNFNRL